MQQQEYKEQYNKYEISVKDLILILWKGKLLFMGLVLGCIVLSAVYTFFIATPEYIATSELIIQKTDTIDTRYGIYTFPSENPNDYIRYIKSNDVLKKVIEEEKLDVSIDSFRKNIKIVQDKERGEETARFLINTSAELGEKAANINNKLVDIYILTQRVVYKKYAVDTFIDNYERNIEGLEDSIFSKERILKERQILLDSISPIYTLQKSLFNDPKTAAAYADKFDLDLNELSQAMLVEENAREIYLKLEEICVNTQKELIDLKESLYQYKDKLKDLNLEKDNIDRAIENDNLGLVFNNKVDVFKNKIMVVSKATKPNKAIKPKKALNLIVGAVLGSMLGVFLTLFIGYWKNN